MHYAIQACKEANTWILLLSCVRVCYDWFACMCARMCMYVGMWMAGWIQTACPTSTRTTGSLPPLWLLSGREIFVSTLGVNVCLELYWDACLDMDFSMYLEMVSGRVSDVYLVTLFSEICYTHVCICIYSHLCCHLQRVPYCRVHPLRYNGEHRYCGFAPLSCVGIPLFFLGMLYRYRIPLMARERYRCT